MTDFRSYNYGEVLSMFQCVDIMRTDVSFQVFFLSATLDTFGSLVINQSTHVVLNWLVYVWCRLQQQSWQLERYDGSFYLNSIFFHIEIVRRNIVHPNITMSGPVSWVTRLVDRCKAAQKGRSAIMLCP